MTGAGAGAGAGAGIFIILLFLKKMSETWVFPYLPFSDLRTMIFPINLNNLWCERKVSSKSERFSIFGSSRFFFIISSPKD